MGAIVVILGIVAFAVLVMEIANLWDHRQDRRWTDYDQELYQIDCDKWKEDHS
jgi:hypothetical protein